MCIDPDVFLSILVYVVQEVTACSLISVILLLHQSVTSLLIALSYQRMEFGYSSHFHIASCCLFKCRLNSLNLSLWCCFYCIFTYIGHPSVEAWLIPALCPVDKQICVTYLFIVLNYSKTTKKHIVYWHCSCQSDETFQTYPFMPYFCCFVSQIKFRLIWFCQLYIAFMITVLYCGLNMDFWKQTQRWFLLTVLVL